MFIKKLYCLLLLVFFSLGISAQDSEIIVTSQMDRNLVYINPAYTGFFETTVFSVLHRSSWIGFGKKGTPGRMLQNAEFHNPLKNQSIALGGLFRHEVRGGQTRSEAFANYSHRIILGNQDRLAFGIKLGASFVSLDQDLILESDFGLDPAFAGFENKIIPNAGVGIAYYGNNYYGGLSIPYLLNNDLKPEMSGYFYLLSGGATLELNEYLLFMPNAVLAYSPSSNLNYQAVLNLKYRDMLLAGVGYRANEAIIFNIGYSINYQFSLNYSYDLSIGPLSTYTNSKGSHEVSLLYYFGYKVNTVSPIDF